MKAKIIILLAICIYSISCTSIPELKSETELGAYLQPNGDLFVFFVDDEREKDDIFKFWEEKQAKFNKQEPSARVCFVNVNTAIALQRKFRVDKRGDTILFQNGKESVRASWSDPERMERWLTILREPQTFHVTITSAEYEILSKETSVLLSFNNNPYARTIGLLNERPNLVYREIHNEDYENFFNSNPLPNHINKDAELLFLFENNATGLHFYKDLTLHETSTLVDYTIQISKWIDVSRVKGMNSILESSPENFQKHAEIYQYVVVVPYPYELKEDYLRIIYEVEEKEENSHFGFLYVESSNAMLPFPICFEIDHNPNPNKDLRTMWNGDNEFNLENFATWIEKIRTNTHEPFTTVKVPESSKSKYFEIRKPIVPITFSELQNLHKNAKEFSLIFCHTTDKLSASAYYAFEDTVALLDSDLKYYAYNVLTNTYRGPPTPVLLIMKGDLEAYLPMKSIRDSAILKNAILTELRKLEHKADL